MRIGGSARAVGVATTAAALLALALIGHLASAHIVPPERLHPSAETYRQLNFVLGLRPVNWELVSGASANIADQLVVLDREAARSYTEAVEQALLQLTESTEDVLPPPARRREATRAVFEASTRAVARTIRGHLLASRAAIENHRTAVTELELARQIWAAFEPEVRASDPRGFRKLGQSWLVTTEALGNPGVLGVGRIAPDVERFEHASQQILDYLEANYGGEIVRASGHQLMAIPAHSATFDGAAVVPYRLPPATNLNKQLPRPRQILNMAVRGVDESETALIALGDMAFDSSYIFGEPARSLAVSCNTCHNKGVTNPNFFIPGLSARPGGLDVSNAFFAPHASNGHFDPIDIPDLRGIRFTAPYGRNGRFDSLREFTRNVIVNEFNGPEPDPVLLDGLVAYMLEIDFLPNPVLDPDGSLTDGATEAARRGERIFRRPFPQMGDRSCASCHMPSDNFVDRKRHDIGTVIGAEKNSRDRALDTPTLLSARYTAPYFHDGSAPTLRAVNEWFNDHFDLKLGADEIDDLTAYLETIGDGVDAYEDTLHTLESEMEEFRFFLSAFEFLESRDKPDLIDTTFRTIAQEIRAHKWDAQDPRHLPVLDRLADLMDEAAAALARGDRPATDEAVAAYRRLYNENVEALR